MRQWPRVLRIRWHISSPRPYSSSARPERVDVRCGSAGHVTIDLFNIVGNAAPNAPLVIHLPSFPSPSGHAHTLPQFLEDRPVASINYRWAPYTKSTASDNDFAAPLHWPGPVHDTSFAFAWLAENLTPQSNSKRDVYIYGSHLGASLAASLALTESHKHSRFGVRGLLAYNGIYNWTMFLPDHRINRPKKGSTPTEPEAGSYLHMLQENMPALFDEPTNLFDPFASPSLFFHSPGLLVPSSFFMSMEHAALIDNMVSDDEIESKPIKQPRKSHLVFPPRQSTLHIPDTLLLHDSAVLTPPKTKTGRTRKRAAKKTGHSLETQAGELAELMRRSIEVVEMKERSRWDEDMHNRLDEPTRRVQLVDVGPEQHTLELDLGETVQETAASWLQERT